MARAALAVKEEVLINTRGMFGAEALNKAKATLESLLESCVTVRGPRDAEGRITYVREPNDGIRLAAAVKLIEFETGKAPTTVEVKAATPGDRNITPQTAFAMLKSNPELAERIMSELVNAAKRVSPTQEVQASDTVSDGFQRGRQSTDSILTQSSAGIEVSDATSSTTQVAAHVR